MAFVYDEKESAEIADRFVFAPIPMVTPALGTELIGAAMYMHPEDDFWNDTPVTNNSTRQSITGIAGMYSSSESWSVGGFHKEFYANDNFRSTGYISEARLNLKFYGIGEDALLKDRSLKYNARATAFNPKFLFKILGNWFIGLEYLIFNWRFKFNFDRNMPDILKKNPL